MAVYLRVTQDYFLTNSPKELFSGVELAARWVQAIAGEKGPIGAGKVISYTSLAQEAFLWPRALSSLSAFTEHVWTGQGKAEIGSKLLEVLSRGSACIGIIITEFFENKVGHLSKVKFVGISADVVMDVIEAVDLGWSEQNLRGKVVVVAKIFLSLTVSALSFATLYRGQSIVSTRVTLVIETALFVSNFADDMFKKLTTPPKEGRVGKI